VLETRADPWCWPGTEELHVKSTVPAHLLLTVCGDHADADLAGRDAVSHALRRGLLHGRSPRGVPRLNAVSVEVEDRLRCHWRVLPPNACGGYNKISPGRSIHIKYLCIRHELTKQAMRQLGAMCGQVSVPT